MTDLITSLQTALSKPNSDGYTVLELISKAGLDRTERNQGKIRQFLKAEIAAGRVIGRIGSRPNISGRQGPVPVFVLVEKKIR